MPESVPRLLAAITGIVAIVAIVFAIKDYLQPPKAKPPSSTSAPTAIHSNAVTGHKKANSDKARRAPTSAAEVGVPVTTKAAAADTRKLIASDGAVTPFTKAATMTNNAPDSADAQDALDPLGAAMNQNGRICYELDTLPNMTKPGDVDAAYYQNWAREYCARIELNPTTATPSH